MAFLAQVSTQQVITKSISTLTLNVSSITGVNLGNAFPGFPSTFSTFAIQTSSLQASTIQTPQFQTDGNALSIRYPFRDPSTTYFYAASTGYIGIGTSSPSNLLEIKDWTASTFTNSLLSLQIGPGGLTTYVASSSNYYYYTGAQQVYSIPPGTARLGLRVYGAGGESVQAANPGGGGAYLEATLDVASLYALNTQFSNLYIVVGTGGVGGSAVPSADFWTGNPGAGANFGWPAGGGFTGIFLSNIGSVAVNTCNNTPLLIAGAGGGGGYGSSGAGGAATWSGTAWSGNNNARTTVANGSYGGGGGSQTQGGTTGTTGAGGVNGSYLRGGTNVPGAGAGYFGGGGGYNGSPSGGGGGGSSWVSLSSFIVTSTGDDAVARNPGGLTGAGGLARSNSAYAGAGYGGVAGTSAAGSNGLVQIIAFQSTIASKATRAMEIRNSAGSLLTSFTSDGRLAINKIAPDTGVSLDIVGPAQFSQVVTTSSLTTSRLTASVDGSITSLSTGIITNSLRLGTLSSVTSINFPGLQANYSGTAVAELATGTGTQELLLYKVSSTTDRVRVQTTGNFVVESGVSARAWPTTTSNATPAFIVNSSSNVGIQTATPQTALDVAGTGRFQALSSLSLNISSINGQVFGSFSGSTNSLSAATIFVSSINGDIPVLQSNLVSTTGGITTNYSTFLSTTLATYSFPYSGETLYLNYTQTVAPYFQLGINNIIGTNASNVSTVNGNTSNNFIVGFQSDFYVPAFIATGLWTLSLFSQASGTNLSVYTSLFQREPATGIESLIATSSNSPFIVPTTKVSLDLTIDVPYTNLSSGNTLVMKIFANNSGNQSRNLTTFYENGNYSHVHTTLGTGSIATNLFQSTVVGLGTLGYVSTLSLTSTVAGLGTAGYISTLQLASFSFFTVSSGTSYTAAPYGQQLVTMSNLNSQFSPVQLQPDGITLNVSTNSIQAFRISYMTGVNQATFSVPRPTLTMAVSTPSNVVYYPSVESIDAGGGTVTFLERLGNDAQILFYMNGLSNYTFTDADESLYRMSFELVQGSVGQVFSTVFVETSLSQFTSSCTFFEDVTMKKSSIMSNAYVSLNTTLSSLTVLGNATFQQSTITNSIYTNYLRVMCNAIIGASSITLEANNISASNLQTSSISLLDQSTMTYKPFFISSGAIYYGSNVASAGGGGTVTATGGSTLSSLFVGSSSNQNFIKFWGSIGEYNNTVIAQQSTGGGTTELLFFEGSSINDQVRFQTTGGIRFETGVSQPRNFLTANQVATPSMFINSSSNVGIGTNNPSFPLDVVGTGRFQTLVSSPTATFGALCVGVLFV